MKRNCEILDKLQDGEEVRKSRLASGKIRLSPQGNVYSPENLQQRINGGGVVVVRTGKFVSPPAAGESLPGRRDRVVVLSSANKKSDPSSDK